MRGSVSALGLIKPSGPEWGTGAGHPWRRSGRSRTGLRLRGGRPAAPARGDDRSPGGRDSPHSEPPSPSEVRDPTAVADSRRRPGQVERRRPCEELALLPDRPVMVSRIKRHTALQLRIVRQVPRARGDAPQALALRLVVRIRSASAQTSCSLRYAILSPHPNAHTRGALPFRLPLLVGPLSLVSGPRFCPLLEVLTQKGLQSKPVIQNLMQP